MRCCHNKKTPRRALSAYILRSIKSPAEQIRISPITPARYITGKSPVAGVWAGAAVAVGAVAACSPTTSTLAGFSFTCTGSLFWVREVELVGVAVAALAAVLLFSASK